MRLAPWIAASVAALALAACGGGGGSDSAKVGACIDSGHKVVDCGSSSADSKLVSDQSDPKATACLVIGDKPQTEVKVGGKKFCAEKK